MRKFKKKLVEFIYGLGVLLFFVGLAGICGAIEFNEGMLKSVACTLIGVAIMGFDSVNK